MNYWDNLFSDGLIWGKDAADSAIWTAGFFDDNQIKKVLIPGIGYGRNTIPFLSKNMDITGIEISNNAIDIAKYNTPKIKIHHGSVLDMPFDNELYGGIYCYSLIHLFDQSERENILASCFNQLAFNGYLVMVVISTESNNYGKGKIVSRNRFLLENGIKVYFYDADSIKEEFQKFGLIDYKLYPEPIKFMTNEEPLICYRVLCRKP